MLVNSNRNPGSVWRLVAAPAPADLHFSENFHGVIPKDNATTIEQLLAVINSPIANAWFDAHCRKRKVVQAILLQLPFPHFDDIAATQVKALVSKLERAVLSKERSSMGSLFYDVLEERFDLLTLTEQLDALVFEAYKIDSAHARSITRYMGKEKRPG